MKRAVTQCIPDLRLQMASDFTAVLRRAVSVEEGRWIKLYQLCIKTHELKKCIIVENYKQACNLSQRKRSVNIYAHIMVIISLQFPLGRSRAKLDMDQSF